MLQRGRWRERSSGRDSESPGSISRQMMPQSMNSVRRGRCRSCKRVPNQAFNPNWQFAAPNAVCVINGVCDGVPNSEFADSFDRWRGHQLILFVQHQHVDFPYVSVYGTVILRKLIVHVASALSFPGNSLGCELSHPNCNIAASGASRPESARLSFADQVDGELSPDSFETVSASESGGLFNA